MIDEKMKNSELQEKLYISENIITGLKKDEFVCMETQQDVMMLWHK